MLKAARDAGVKRVVMTSNFGAVGSSNLDSNTVTTKENWTNPDQKGLSIYEKSKLFLFNVSLPCFAYLTGRSLSAFKRDFKTIFNDTPNRWSVQKCLKEFLIRFQKTIFIHTD